MYYLIFDMWLQQENMRQNGTLQPHYKLSPDHFGIGKWRKIALADLELEQMQNKMRSGRL